MIYQIIVVFIYLLANTVANARVYYIDDSNVVQKTNGISYDSNNNFEQSSRDLDLSFSTGDTTSNDNDYPRENYPIFKRVNPIRPYETVDRQYLDINNKEMNHPRAYKLIEVAPERQYRFEGIFDGPKKNGKFMQSATGDRKGEVILELRVVTNNDAM